VKTIAELLEREGGHLLLLLLLLCLAVAMNNEKLVDGTFGALLYAMKGTSKNEKTV
jgi:hypothetical protein